MRLVSVLIALSATFGQNGQVPPVQRAETDARSELAGSIERYIADRDLVRRSLAAPASPNGRQAMRAFQQDWLRRLEKLSFSSLGHDAQVDYLLFKNHLGAQIRRSELAERDYTAADVYTPFAPTIWALREALRKMEPLNAEKAASTLTEVDRQVKAESAKLDKAKEQKTKLAPVSASISRKALDTVSALRDELKEWYTFYDGYDPLFTWWNGDPYKQLDASLDAYGKKLKEALIPDEKEERVPPIGADGLAAELAAELIPYTPDELVAIAEKQFAWCEGEMKKASREMGFGDDWKKALEKVKDLHVAPGEQPEMIKELALEAIDFVEKRDLVTVPELAKETWRMTMMPAERQRTSPFFLGGEVIMVSFPTNTMTHEEKLMSMRGNNRHFARATVHHELIPGHHLQGFMTDRYRSYRQLFSTPFWIEGWALYWEFLLWEMGFPKTPENKVGMLFWRMHRCARIIFSLRYHLGTMTPAQCVDFLVDRVGHERANADAEVRRSFNGTYPPLYQAAYMLGALQIWRLREELVDSGKMKEKAFHDAILHENSIPIEMLRAILTNQKLTPDFKTSWRFSGG